VEVIVIETSVQRDAMTQVVVMANCTGRNALTTPQLICDRSHAEHSPSTARQDRRQQPADTAAVQQHQQQASASQQGQRRLRLGDGADRRHITRAGAAAAAASRRQITRHRPTGPPARPTRSWPIGTAAAVASTRLDR